MHIDFVMCKNLKITSRERSKSTLLSNNYMVEKTSDQLNKRPSSIVGGSVLQ